MKDSLSAIANEVVDDVLKEAEKTILTAEAHAKNSFKTAKDEADQAYIGILDDATRKTNAEKRKIESLTEVESRNQQLQLKEALVDEAFNRAIEKLAGFVKTEAYHAYLMTLIEESARKMGSEELTIYLNGADRTWIKKEELKKLEAKIKSNLRLGDKEIHSLGGCVIQTANGKLVFDSTIENQLQNLKPTLRIEVAKILFGKGAAGNVS